MAPLGLPRANSDGDSDADPDGGSLLPAGMAGREAPAPAQPAAAAGRRQICQALLEAVRERAGAGAEAAEEALEEALAVARLFCGGDE